VAENPFVPQPQSIPPSQYTPTESAIPENASVNPFLPLPISGKVDTTEIVRSLLAKNYVGPDKPTAEELGIAIESAKKKLGESARIPVIDASKPWGWAKQNEKGDLLYLTLEGERRWIPPAEVKDAVDAGMQPLSNADELRLEREREIKDSPVDAAVTNAVNFFGGARWLQRHTGSTYKDYLAGKVTEGSEVSMTPEEQQLQEEANPIASVVGDVVNVGAGLLVPVVGPYGAAGKLGAKIASGLTSTKAIIKTSQILAEGAAIGLSGGAAALGTMSDKEYDKMSVGDIAGKLAKDSAIGAAVNGVLSGGVWAIGKLGKAAWGKVGILKKAGTSEREIIRKKELLLDAERDYSIYENIVKERANPRLTMAWQDIKTATNEGIYEQVNKPGFDFAKEIKKAEDLTNDIARLKNNIHNLQNPTVPLPYVVLDNAEQILLSRLNVANKELLESNVKISMVENTQYLQSELASVISTSSNPAKAYANFRKAGTDLLKLEKSISSAIPFADVFGRAALGGALFGGAIGGYSESWEGGIKGALLGAAAPWFLTKAIMFGAGKNLIPVVSKTSEAAAKLLKGFITSGTVHIMSDDEKDDELHELRMHNAIGLENASRDGHIDSGMDPKLADAEAKVQAASRNLLLAAAKMNRVDYSKMSDAVKNPAKALVAIANGKANKQQVLTLKTLYPDVYGKVQSYAKIAFDSMKPSEKNTKIGNYLKSLTLGLDSRPAMKSVMSMPEMPKEKSAGGKPMKIDAKSFSRSSTGYQDLQMRLGTGKH